MRRAGTTWLIFWLLSELIEIVSLAIVIIVRALFVLATAGGQLGWYLASELWRAGMNWYAEARFKEDAAYRRAVERQYVAWLEAQKVDLSEGVYR